MKDAFGNEDAFHPAHLHQLGNSRCIIVLFERPCTEWTADEWRARMHVVFGDTTPWSKLT